jgi:hypothetical protein
MPTISPRTCHEHGGEQLGDKQIRNPEDMNSLHAGETVVKRLSIFGDSIAHRDDRLFFDEDLENPANRSDDFADTLKGFILAKDVNNVMVFFDFIIERFSRSLPSRRYIVKMHVSSRVAIPTRIR